MTDRGKDVLEENVGRLVRRWADPLKEEDVRSLCTGFLDRLQSEDPVRSEAPHEDSRNRFWTTLALSACSMMICGTLLMAILLRPDPSRDASNRNHRPVRETAPAALALRPVPGIEPVGEVFEDAVLAHLKWLSRHQSEDGSWSAAGFTSRCNRELPDGKKYAGGKCGPTPGGAESDGEVTGLAVLAFLGAGYSHLSKDTYDGIRFGDVVRKALQWMISRQDARGFIDSRGRARSRYNHLILAEAMTEAYGLTGSLFWKDAAQKSIDHVAAIQNPDGGWAEAPGGKSTLLATAWAVLAIKSAEISGLSFPRAVHDGARRWFDAMEPRTPAPAEPSPDRLLATSVSLFSRYLIDKGNLKKGIDEKVDLLLRNPPEWHAGEIDFLYWHFASYALYAIDGSKGPRWTAWNEAMKRALVRNQHVRESGCRSASWDPVGRWSAKRGRMFATAINGMTLQVYYRYADQFGGK